MVFPVVIYGCESYIIKKAECQRIDAFELWCWRRLLRVSWTARNSNQSILKEISPGCSLEGLMLKLKLQYFGHLMGRADLFEKTLILERLRAGGEGDDREWDGWMASPTRWTWVWVDSGSWWWTGRPGVLQFMGSQRVGHDWATELNWIELMHYLIELYHISSQKPSGKPCSAFYFSIHSPSTEFYQSSSEIVLESDHYYPLLPKTFPFINYLHLFVHFLVYLAQVSHSNILSTV